MTIPNQPTPNQTKEDRHRYNVTAVGRHHAEINVPLMLSEEVWRYCVQFPAGNDREKMADLLVSLLGALHEVLKEDGGMSVDLDYELPAPNGEHVAPEYTPTVVKLKAIYEETAEDFTVVTAYLAAEAEPPMYMSNVYLDRAGCVVVVVRGTCDGAMRPEKE